MKLPTMIGKNLKLLFRSKESAYTIVFGPLLIILIVSFAFMGSDTARVNIGVFAEDHGEIAQQTIRTLNENYVVNVYGEQDACIASVVDGDTHACVVFGVVEDGVTPVTFHLDYSRMDLVYQVIDQLSEELNVQTDELREQLATNAIQRMETSAILIDELTEKTGAVLLQIDDAVSALDRAESGLQSIPNKPLNITDIKPLTGYQIGLAQNADLVATEALDALDEARRVITKLEGECDECPEGLQEDVDEAKDRISDAEDMIYQITEDHQPQLLEEASMILRFAIDDIDLIEGTIKNVTTSGKTVTEGVHDAVGNLEGETRELERISSRLEYVATFLRGQEFDASTLSVPVKISTENIAVSDDKLSFAYPYLLVLIIMFIGLLLSSMLVVTDKTSRAAFRNFTTPTSDAYHVFVSFLTAFCILAVEVLVILFISTLFIAKPILGHFGPTMMLVGFAIVIFTFLGMIIGYLSKTEEAAMIASISVGSVLLFVSNLVFPMEGMARTVQFLSGFNPYIVLSELLRRSMLYGISAKQIASELFLLGVFIVLLLTFTIIAAKRIKRTYFRQEEPLLQKKHIPVPLHLGARMIYNEMDLMDALDRMTRIEFTHVVPNKENVIALWAERELRNKRLARQLRTTNKERMILKLDAYLKRHGKHMKR